MSESSFSLAKPPAALWSVGVITAPRPIYTLPNTLRSLAEAGWEGPSVFAEKGSLTAVAHPCDPRRTIEYPFVRYNDGMRGCYQNWLFALRSLLSGIDDAVGRGYPEPDFLLLCEDDIEVSRNLRAYLDNNPPPASGIASLYTARRSHRPDQIGWSKALRLPQDSLGALAIVLTPAVARAFAADSPRRSMPNGTDHAIGLFCLARRLPLWFHTPSFVRHIGVQSALGNPGGVEKNRNCEQFLEDASAFKLT